MTARRITDATVEPLSIWQVRDHLRIDDDAFDLPIAGWITAARRQAEHELGRALISQTWELVLPSFPDPLQLPILGVLSGVLLLGEPMSWQKGVGGLLTVLGVGVIVIRRARIAEPRTGSTT